jgi:UPF0271 protein
MMSAERPELAEAVAAAVKDVDPNLIYMTIAGSRLYRTCKEAGLRVAGEVYSDRAYTNDGMLVSRKLPGAVITDAGAVVERITRFVETGVMQTYDGGTLEVDAQSICMHGDTPGAARLIKVLRESLDEKGVSIVPVGTLV